MKKKQAPPTGMPASLAPAPGKINRNITVQYVCPIFKKVLKPKKGGFEATILSEKVLLTCPKQNSICNFLSSEIINNSKLILT